MSRSNRNLNSIYLGAMESTWTQVISLYQDLRHKFGQPSYWCARTDIHELTCTFLRHFNGEVNGEKTKIRFKTRSVLKSGNRQSSFPKKVLMRQEKFSSVMSGS